MHPEKIYGDLLYVRHTETAQLFDPGEMSLKILKAT